MEVGLVLTKSYLARYPFLPEAAEYMRMLDLTSESLASQELKPIVDRAEERIEESLRTNPPIVSYGLYDDEIEISSFPVAIMMASSIDDEYVRRRYALAEARRVYSLLLEDDEEVILHVSRSFNWRIEPSESQVGNVKIYCFKLHFADYLRNVRSFNEKEWKLVNRVVKGGWVYLMKREAARLLQEEVQRSIEKKLDLNVRRILPSIIIDRADRLREKYAANIKRMKREELPKEAVKGAFPPCIRRLYDAAASGSRLSHVGRFTLTSFLLRVGVPPDKVIDLFRSSSDFNERMTRYQVEHISGIRGSRTSYMPPKCSTLQTHGLCPSIDDTCRGANHPLTSYRRRIRMLKRESAADTR